jgi:hypothetical protein
MKPVKQDRCQLSIPLIPNPEVVQTHLFLVFKYPLKIKNQ